MEVVYKDTISGRFLSGHQFCEEVGGGVVLSRDMMQLDPFELVLKLAHLLAVHHHERALAGGLLHDLVDDQLRVTEGIQPHGAELDGDAQSVDKGLILRGVV